MTMSGLLRRIRGPRAADETAGSRAAEDVPTGADPGLPAGADPQELEQRSASRRRGRMRKRLRQLRRTRELLLRDLGGLVYELHRTPGSAEGERLVTDKVARLQLLDAEVRELEQHLEERSGELVLREPGIGGFCQSCGEIFGSADRYCSNCGALLARGGHAVVAEKGAPGAAATRVDEAVAASQPEPEPEPEKPTPKPRAAKAKTE